MGNRVLTGRLRFIEKTVQSETSPWLNTLVRVLQQEWVIEGEITRSPEWIDVPLELGE